MSNDFHVHDDVLSAYEWYDIPNLTYGPVEIVYILQEDRLVFIGPIFAAENFLKTNNGQKCEGIYKKRVATARLQISRYARMDNAK